MHPRGDRAAAAAVTIFLLVSVLGAAAPAAAAESDLQARDRPALDADAPAPQVDTEATANNTTSTATANTTSVSVRSTPVPHRNPASIEDEGDAEALRNALASQLVTRLAGSAEALTENETRRARSLLGEEYNRTLEKYVDVAGGGGPDPQDRLFREAGRDQRAFVDSVATYRETYADYRAAKRAGEEERALRLARRLDEVAQNVTRRGDSLQASYRNVTVREETVNRTIERIGNVQQNVTRQQQTVQSREFVDTSLAVSADRERVSFNDPLPISGRLTTANGTPVAGETVQLRIRDRTYRVETNEAGEFTVEYRPVTLPVDAREVTVSYVPNDSSPYLRTNATVDVAPTQVTPSVTVTDVSRNVRYGDRLNVSGRVAVGDMPVSGVPVTVRMAGVRIGTVRTNESGAFRLQRNVSGVPAGEHQVVAAVGAPDRVLAPATDTASVRVAETETSLDLTATHRSAGTITVRGRLRTTDGRALADRRVAIHAGGTLVQTVRTDESGVYAANVTVPADVRPADGGPVTVRASFDGSDTSLASARATQSVTFRPVADDDPARDGDPSALQRLIARLLGAGIAIPWLSEDVNDVVLTGFATALGLLFSGLLYTGSFLRRSDDHSVGGDAPLEATGASEPDSTAATAAALGAARREAMRERLAADDFDGAVVTAYAAVRESLEGRVEVPAGGTHWEFYQALDPAELAVDRDAIRRLTQLYEFAAFAPDETPRDRAEEAIGLAERLTEGSADDGGDRT